MQLHPFMPKLIKNVGDGGFSLVEVIISSAIFVIVVLGLSTAYSQYFKAAKSSESWIGTNAAVNQTVKLLETPEFCDSVLRAAGGGPVTMDPNASVTIGEIHMKSAIDAGNVDTVLLKAGQKINEKYKVLTMTVSEQFAGVGRSTATTTTQPYVAVKTTLNKTWTTYVAKLTFAFEQGGKQLSGSPGQSVPITLAVNTGDLTDYRCYINVAQQQVCESNGGYIDDKGNCAATMYDRITNNGKANYDCSTCATTPTPNCNAAPCAANPCSVHAPVAQWVMHGFDSTGMPQCVCQNSCY